MRTRTSGQETVSELFNRHLPYCYAEQYDSPRPRSRRRSGRNCQRARRCETEGLLSMPPYNVCFPALHQLPRDCAKVLGVGRYFACLCDRQLRGDPHAVLVAITNCKKHSTSELRWQPIPFMPPLPFRLLSMPAHAVPDALKDAVPETICTGLCGAPGEGTLPNHRWRRPVTGHMSSQPTPLP